MYVQFDTIKSCFHIYHLKSEFKLNFVLKLILIRYEPWRTIMLERKVSAGLTLSMCNSHFKEVGETLQLAIQYLEVQNILEAVRFKAVYWFFLCLKNILYTD